MARIRTIKPEFWTDAKTGTLPEFAKCLLIGLLNHADDYGVLEYDLIGWRARIFPYHSDTTTGAVGRALVENLLPSGMVILFFVRDEETGNRTYLFIRHFHRHQVINKPSRPLLKDWKLGDTPRSYAKRMGFEFENFDPTAASDYGSTTGGLPVGKERKGKEGNGGSVEADASTDAGASVDHRTRLFTDGLQKLAAMTGKGPDACRSFVGKCLKACGDDAVTVLGLIEEAERNRAVDPSAWIVARLQTTGPPSKPLTAFQLKQQETNDVRSQLRTLANSGNGGGTPDRLLSHDHGERPEGVRGGTGAIAGPVPGKPDRGSD